MKITKISLRQELAYAVMKAHGKTEWEFDSFTDDDLIAEALLIILKNILKGGK